MTGRLAGMKTTTQMIKLYNTEEEIGVRLLCILEQLKTKASFLRLLYYDYFSLHLDDIDEKYESLHPSNPSHSTEIIVKRELVNSAIECMALKGLLDVKYTVAGIYYTKNSVTGPFLECFQSSYITKLRDYIQIVDEIFREYSDIRLQKYIDNNLGKWTGQFERQYLTRLAEGYHCESDIY